MSCQCHQIGGPFISEDPDCSVHGYAQTNRVRAAEALQAQADDTTDPVVLRRIVADLVSLIEDIS